MTATIRPAEPGDATGIARVHVASWRTTYPGVIPDRYLVGLSVREQADRWRRLLAARTGRDLTFVVDDPEHGVVGFGSCGPERGRVPSFQGEIYTIYLFDFAQGRGLGRELMARMAGAMLAVGTRSATVWVVRENPARWFYERLRAERVGEQQTVFAGVPLTEVAYGWRDLAVLADLSRQGG